MSRTSTTYYRAEAETTFAWAGDANDFFSRTLDLAYLAQAVDRHDHTSGRGRQIGNLGYALGSIPTNAIVANPIFPGSVSVAAGGIHVSGDSSINPGALSVSGTVTAQGGFAASGGAFTATAGGLSVAGAISTSVGGLSVAGAITTSAGGMSVTGACTIVGTLAMNTPGTLACGTITCGSVSITGTLSVTTTLLAAGISTVGGTVVLTGNTTINSGFLHVNGPLVVGGNISNTSGGADFFGTTNLHNDSTALANFGVLGNLGVTGILQPAVTGGSNLGDPSLQWATLFAQHFAISSTCSAAGLLTLGAGLTVTAGFTDVQALTVHGSISANSATSSFAMIQPVPDNTYSCGNGSLRWTAVYATTGAIQTSSIEAKEHLEPIDPDLALKVAVETPILEFQYRTSDEDGNYKSRKTKLPRRLRQVGFVAEEAHPLLLVEEGGVNGQNTASIALAAIQALSAKVDALTAELADLKGTIH